MSFKVVENRADRQIIIIIIIIIIDIDMFNVA